MFTGLSLICTFVLSTQSVLWDTFKQNNYITVGRDGGCRVGEVRAGVTSPCPTIRVLRYSNCQRSPFLSEFSEV